VGAAIIAALQVLASQLNSTFSAISSSLGSAK
jgi:Flp pilus assembly pilin Flp